MAITVLAAGSWAAIPASSGSAAAARRLLLPLLDRIRVVLRLFVSRAILLGRISLISAVWEGSRDVAHSLR
jgi:hypothetical protein